MSAPTYSGSDPANSESESRETCGSHQAFALVLFALVLLLCFVPFLSEIDESRKAFFQVCK
jgi:hypothetical protein